jgi:hypothetical protein
MSDAFSPTTRLRDDEHWSEVTRLWQAVKRDYFIAVEGSVGLPFDEVRRNRLLRNWEHLCKRAPNVATRLARGLHEIDLVFTETNETLRSDDDPDDLEQPSTSDTTRAPHAGTSETLADLIDLAARRREHCGDSLDSPD